MTRSIITSVTFLLDCFHLFPARERPSKSAASQNSQVFPNNLTVKVLAELVLYFSTGAFTLCKLLPLSILLRYLAKEIKLIHRKSDVNLEWLTLRHLQSLFVCNDQIISSSIAVFQRFQIKLATESTLCTIIACLICNNLLNITNLPAIFIRKVNLIGNCFTVGTNSILLIEIQRKNHITDFTVC